MATSIAEISLTTTRHYEVSFPDNTPSEAVVEWVEQHVDEIYQERSETTWDLEPDMDGDICVDGPVSVKIKLVNEDGEYALEGLEDK